jgi:hypothetical protein
MPYFFVTLEILFAPEARVAISAMGLRFDVVDPGDRCPAVSATIAVERSGKWRGILPACLFLLF